MAWAINGGIAALAGFILHLNATQVAAITTITTALAAAFTAIKARPVAVSVIGGAFTTIAVACEAFGVHLPATSIAGLVAGISAFLGLVFRANLTPTASYLQRRLQWQAGVNTPTVTVLPMSTWTAGYNPVQVTPNVTPPVADPGIDPDATPEP